MERGLSLLRSFPSIYQVRRNLLSKPKQPPTYAYILSFSMKVKYPADIIVNPRRTIILINKSNYLLRNKMNAVARSILHKIMLRISTIYVISNDWICKHIRKSPTTVMEQIFDDYFQATEYHKNHKHFREVRNFFCERDVFIIKPSAQWSQALCKRGISLYLHEIFSFIFCNTRFYSWNYMHSIIKNPLLEMKLRLWLPISVCVTNNFIAL